MKIVLFVHAIASCWNNGNAHFLRGLGLALQQFGHEVLFCEPRDSWSETNLIHDHGKQVLQAFREGFPTLEAIKYDPAQPDFDALTHGADLVIVHEWNDPSLVTALGRMRLRGARFKLLFHDTHHRAATAPHEMRKFDLSGYDGVLAFGEALAELYRRRGFDHVWPFHEAADITTFHPRTAENRSDLVWIGNWGDEERSAELNEFLIEPAQALGLRTEVYGVRYPQSARGELAARGIAYRGWLPNYLAPEVFAGSTFTVHVPRRPYASALPGIPTIRVFEALACGIPLVSAPWQDSEGLFAPDCYLTARNGNEMKSQIRAVLHDAALREELRANGLASIAARHTCAHRAQELLNVHVALSTPFAKEAA